MTPSVAGVGDANPSDATARFLLVALALPDHSSVTAEVKFVEIFNFLKKLVMFQVDLLWHKLRGTCQHVSPNNVAKFSEVPLVTFVGGAR